MPDFFATRADYPHAGTGARDVREGAGILPKPVGGGPIEPAQGELRRNGGLRVLLANEPRSYRESIAAVFRQLRPGLDLEVAEPQALEARVSHSLPDVAICSRATGAVRDLVPVWVELCPDHAAQSVVSERGRETEFAEIQLEDLLSIVDRAAAAV